MATKKKADEKPIFTKQIRREKFGKVKVVEIKNLKTGTVTFRYECRMSVVPKSRQYGNYPTWKEAKSAALQLDADIENGRLDSNDPIILRDLKKVAAKIETSKILDSEIFESKRVRGSRIRKDKTKRYASLSYAPKTNRDNLESLIDAGIKINEVFHTINEKREAKGFTAYRHLEDYLDQYVKDELRKLEKATAPKINYFTGLLLSKRLKKGNVKKTSGEWRRVISNLDKWIGDCSSAEKGFALKERVENGIYSALNDAGRAVGDYWSQSTRWKYAKKAKEFGKFMVEGVDPKHQWDKNPFIALPEDFAPKGLSRPKTFTVDEVAKLFEVASKEENRSIIDYMSFLFFSGPRPYEIAGEETYRRLPFKNMKGWEHKSKVTGGVLFDIFAKDDKGRSASKMGRDRIADLTANGVEWIRWAHEGKLPNESKVFYSRRIFDRVKEEALDYYWPQEVSRHTFTSMANNSTHFEIDPLMKGDYWIKRCGHERKTYDDYYGVPVLPKVCEDYFNILPPKKIAPSVKGQGDRAKSASQSADSV